MRRYEILSILLLLLIIETGFCQDSDCENSSLYGMHVFGATDGIKKIDVQVPYYVPSDREPLQDWRERVEYHLCRVKKFHDREFCGQSELIYTIYPSPFVGSVTRSGFPQDDVNRFFWYIINDVWHSGRISFDEDMFPILLVLSDVNFSPGYDDWTRTCNGDGCIFPGPHSKCAGHVKDTGEDRPGTRCGGARSVFWPEKHIGLGLVTADGWRVPIKGTDCVVYHEGVGHAIGLPHPEPIDNSVMGLAQYEDSINKTWVNEDQKEKLGWRHAPIDRSDLFSTFEVSHSPTNPSATSTVIVKAKFPSRFIAQSITAKCQNGLREPFQSLGEAGMVRVGDNTLAYWCLPPLPVGESVGYRVRIETTNGEREEIWNYYKVRR